MIMKITTVLFDLDGTLLPMDQDVFIKAYFKGLSKKLIPLGYNPEVLVNTVLKGTGAMIANTGERTNKEVFWDVFTDVYGNAAMEHLPVFDEFYLNEFNDVKAVCGFDRRADMTVKLVKRLGLRTSLATNPLFPPEATENRIKWAGLDSDDFDLVTTYDNSRYCKPSLHYYEEICEKLGVVPSECLMVGNDVGDDMVAKKLGMKVFLLTDNLINSHVDDVSEYHSGSFGELVGYIESLV